MILREQFEAAGRLADQQHPGGAEVRLMIHAAGIAIRVSGRARSYHREVAYDDLAAAPEHLNPLVIEIKEGLRQVA